MGSEWLTPALHDEHHRRMARSVKVHADYGDASATIGVTIGRTHPWATTLTANRTVTLSTMGAREGDELRVIRTGLGAFTLDVGGLKTIPSATAASVLLVYDGTAWRLAAYSPL